MPGPLQQAGSQPQKQPKYAPIFQDRMFTGLFTQRNVLHDPADIMTAKYYGGRPDALWQGSNVELTNELTLKRRPGLTELSTTTYPTPPVEAYSFELTNGTIRLIIDTQATALFTISAIANASGGSTVYTGVFTGGGSNAFAGYTFLVAGLTAAANNGTFFCTASSATTLTLSNPIGVSATNAGTAISAGATYWDQQNGTKTLLYSKAPGAGQTHFQGVNGILYAGDGVDTWKWTPLNATMNPTWTNTLNVVNGTGVSVWNWGIATPTLAPSVNIVASGSSTSVWQANTVYSTMGLTIDAYNNIWQLISVDADPNNPNSPNAIYGTSGDGAPLWNPALAGTTTETSGTEVWVNYGQVMEWSAGAVWGDAGNTNPGAPCCCYDPTSDAFYLNFAGGGSTRTSGHAPGPKFTATPGWNFTEGNGAGSNAPHWFFFCTASAAKGSPVAQPWKPSHAYTRLSPWPAPPTPSQVSQNAVFEPYTMPPNFNPASVPPPAPIYIHFPTISTNSGTGYAPFPNPAVDTTYSATNNYGYGLPGAPGLLDGQLAWICLGSATRRINHQYDPWSQQGVAFGCFKDPNGNMQVCVTNPNSTGSNLSSGTATASITWGTTYGAVTIDGDLWWSCVGPQVTWAAGQIWNLPLSGFSPQSQAQRYGGSTIIGTSNSSVQTVIVSGTSGAGPEPTWANPTPPPATTTDNTITWFAENFASAQSLAWKLGYAYGYSWKARAVDDFYSPLPLGGGGTGVYQTPPGGPGNPGPLGAPTGSATEAVSTCSPPFIFVGPNTGAVNFIYVPYSPDPQVDTIIIWRSADGGGDGQMFELTEVPNNFKAAGAAYPNGGFIYRDFQPDTAVSLAEPGLNYLIPAPIDDVNDPPDPTFLPMAYNFERIWGAEGENVNFSGGPDTQVGNPNEAFAPADYLPFLAAVTRLVKTPQGLVTFLTDSIEVIAGGPQTSSFFSVTWAPGIGLLSYNMLDVFAGEIYFFSADNQFRIMTPSLNISNAGFAIGDQLANLPNSGVSDTTWNSATGYVASHQNGTENAIFLADGNTGWYRLNPRQAGATPSTEPVWSPYASLSGINGAQLVKSIETAPGIRKLLVGSNVNSQPLLYRDQTVFTDNGTPYGAWFTMGSIMLVHPGELAVLKFMEFDFSGAPSGLVGYRPTVSYLLDELSGTFTPFTHNPVFDPPSLYGRTTAPATYSPNRYYFLGNASLARCRHLQIKVDFGTTSVGNEVFNATIFGRVLVET